MTHVGPDIAFINPPAPPRKLTFQFSIRTILIAATILVLIAGMIVATPVLAILAAVAFVATTAILSTCIFCARGWFRAFSMGAILPHLLSYLALFEGLRSPEALLFLIAISISSSLVVGLIAAITHGFLARRGGVVQVPNIPLLRKWLTNESVG